MKTLIHTLRAALLLGLSLFTTSLHAQTPKQVWEKRYNGPANGHDGASGVVVDAAGNVVVTGISRNANGDGDYSTAKYAAADGSLIWEKRYNGPGNDHDFASGVVVDGAGNVVVTGNSRNASGNFDYYTAKYAAADGALLWERRYNGLGNGDDYANSVVVDGAGNVVVTGVSENASGNSDYYTAKYAAANGSLLWERRHNGPANSNDYAASVAVDGAGNVVVTGNSIDESSNNDYYTAKYAAADGALLWEKRYNGPGNQNDIAEDVAVDGAGNVVVTGSSFNASFNDDIYTAKYAEADGALLWERRYNGPGNGNETAFEVVVDGAGNVVVAGYSRDASGSRDFYTAKYAAADGALLWEKLYNGPANRFDYATSVAVDGAGNVVVTGYSFDAFATGDYYTAKYAATDTMMLALPVEGRLIGNDVQVSFTLPEAALPGSVKLTFTNGATSRILTLAATQETAGAHAFLFFASSPGGRAEVASFAGPAFVSGNYTVTLDYQNLAGAPAASSVAANVELDMDAPTSGTMEIDLPDEALPGGLLSATATGWTGVHLPLSYEIRDPSGNLLAAGASATLSFNAPAQAGNYTYRMIVVDAAGNRVEAGIFFSVLSVPAVAGNYAGLLHSVPTATLNNTGAVALKVTPTGAFTGKVFIGGAALSVSGTFGANGLATFKGATPLPLALKAKPTPIPLGNLALTISGDSIVGSLTNGAAVSNVTAERAVPYDGKTAPTTVPATILDAVTKGYHTGVLPSEIQGTLTSDKFPQGDGVLSFTVSKKGTFKVAGVLADGTKFSAGSALDKLNSAPLFAQLYKKKSGLFAVDLKFDATRTDSDALGANALWMRPADAAAKHYPTGWPTGIMLDLLAARYRAPQKLDTTSAFPGLGADDLAAGNATLTAVGGKLTAPVVNNVNISTKNKVTNAPATDKDFKLTFDAKKGTLAGTFTHTDSTKPKFTGRVFQKGTTTGGYGFFLSTKPKTGPSGESGAITLLKK